MELITPGDYFLLPFYLVVILLIARSIQNKYYPVDHPWRKYFMRGLLVKIAGAILIGLIYRYYWGYGDTYNYFFFGKLFNEPLLQASFNHPRRVVPIPALKPIPFSFFVNRESILRLEEAPGPRASN